MTAVDHEIMALRLARDRFADRAVQLVVVEAFAHRRPQVRRVVLTETHVKHPGASQADAVARLAKIMGERRDEADLAAGFLDRDVSGRTAAAIIGLFQRPGLRQACAHQGQGQVLFQAIGTDIAHRHDLDDGHVVALVAAPGDHAVEFKFVDAAQGDGVDLDLEARRLRGLHAFENLVQLAPARHLGELRRIQRVHGDVDAPHAACLQFLGVFGKLAAIGRHRQLVERAGADMPAQAAKEAHDVLAHQGLASGQPELPCAEANEGTADAVDFFEGQDLRLGQKGHVFGHAIHAAKIAAIGDG